MIYLTDKIAARAVYGVLRSSIAGVLLAGWLSVVSPGVAAREVLAGPVPASVVQVIDGDTVIVRARVWLGQDVIVRVRLSGIDAPELRARCDEERRLALAARAYLSDRVVAGSITLTDIHYGKYAGRVIARLIDKNGVDIAKSLIENGFARTYNGGRRGQWCIQTGSLERRR
jgi:endonuclease YncB( thermonuclease family)